MKKVLFAVVIGMTLSAQAGAASSDAAVSNSRPAPPPPPEYCRDHVG
ncbi:hypothetical protein SCARR_04067 [Pontiella sulfatireligans]|uniref:Uncharacterized protein n=1 Tax=Pontiella sulfatireligans TaxID=2750658 RepID=A0A6C2URY6_9BACT|nr:hypothetical protein SCARR_04067 [Pontiella sulfatireligans]